MKPDIFLKEFLKKKIGAKKINSIKNIDLISSGILDSLDVVTLSILIKKKYKVNINISTEKSLLIFRSYNKLIKEISKNAK
ncbi:MAG: Acyl carrier protein [Pelagibacterales bacterium]|nr:Acyl carrier protein [Pelagibacterales bacterium]|tara:strand:- start:1793 stop:2035 length:243 start_codon:yes stop_codon:yes gene_type:complete